LQNKHSFDAISLMRTILYGPGNHCHSENSHVLQALIRRFHEAADDNAASVACWGSDKPKREFLHVEDMSRACVYALELYRPNSSLSLQHLNVGTGADLTVSGLTQASAQTTGFQSEIQWDLSNPDGTLKKQLVVSQLRALGWKARLSLEEDLSRSVVNCPSSGDSRL
jgi:GDP-L-fucose synthase